MAANAEEFLLRLNQQISGPASVAAGALAKLESQIRAEESALHGMEDSLRAAKTKLGELQEGFGGKVDIAGITKARAEIEKLQAKIEAGKDNRGTLESSRGAVKKSGEDADAAKRAKIGAKAQEQAENAAQGEAAAKAKIAEKAAKAEASAKSKADTKAKSDAEKAAKGEVTVKAKAAAETKRIATKAAKDAKDAAKESDLSKIGDAAKEADGPIGKIAKGFEKLKAAGPAAVLVAVVVVLLAVAAAAIAGAVALTRFALASADASRSSRLLSGAAAGGAATGAELEAVINDVANKTPLARDRIAEMGRAMEIARLQGRNMQNALEAAATASSAIGDSAGAALTSIATNSQNARRFMLTRNDFTGVSAELEGTGLAFADVAASIAAAQGISVERAAQLIKRGQITVKDGLEAMNDAVQKKFGKTVAGQMLSLNTQLAKMKEGLGRLFDGVDIEPFLRGLKLITGLFSEQTVTGAALKTLFASMFSGLAAASEGVFPLISAFLRGMVIAALTSYIAFLRVRKAIKEAFGGDSASEIDWIKTAMVAGKYAVYAFGVALFAIAGILAVIAAVFIPLAIVLSLPFILAAAVTYGLYRVIMMIVGAASAMFGAISGAIGSIASLDLAAIGLNLVTSLANAITSGASLVIAAVTSLGTSAMSSLEGILGIASPSKVFTAYGKFTAEGFAEGVEEGTPAANDTVKQLGMAEPSSGGARAPGNGGPLVVIENISFTGARADFEEFKMMMLDTLEQALRGGPEPVT